MALVTENLKKCGVKIEVEVKGVPNSGSGVIYETPNYCDYNYVLTAKHILQESSQISLKKEAINFIKVLYDYEGNLKKLELINYQKVEKSVIEFEEDFVIILVSKKEGINFPQILVSDSLQDSDENFFCWSVFSANLDELNKFKFQRDDPQKNRWKFIDPPSYTVLNGISGSGLFLNERNILYGIISRYPTESFENETIDCASLSFEKINRKLASIGKVLLDTNSAGHKREIGKSVVDIHQAIINEVCLDLDLAQKRLKTDMTDDWFHDPLKYIDLLNQDFLFEQFQDFFYKNKYKASLAEKLYVPKKQYTLRKALISPFTDRIMYMAVVGVLAKRLDNALISNVYSARFNRNITDHLIINGVEQWKKMEYKVFEDVNLKDKDGKYIYNCILKIDILNFYDNINKKLLFEKIKRVCKTPNETKATILLNDILVNISEKQSGIPQNSDASSLLATFYLNQVDTFMNNNVPTYYRFMDDIRIVCKDKYEARNVLQLFEYELSRCSLSVNSQKTEILTITDDSTILHENQIKRVDFGDLFDFEINKISRYRKSDNYTIQNDAFHLSVRLLTENIANEDLNDQKKTAKRLNYALNTIENLGKKNINLYSTNSDFISSLQKAVESLIDKPWVTTQVCKVLNLINTEVINEKLLPILNKIVLNENYNIYTFQVYQIWLLLAKHKCKSFDLIKFAVSNIEKNDETQRAVIAAMIIYVCSVDDNYKRVILRKFTEQFTHGYLQNRISLISLRSIDPSLIPLKSIHPSLKKSFRFTSYYKDKDLVYIYGFEADKENDNFEQLYSI